jgi:hypothetical protein
MTEIKSLKIGDTGESLEFIDQVSRAQIEETREQIESIEAFSVINNITQTSGEITLEVNKIYSMNLTGATTFALPNPINKNIFNQIKIMAKVTGTPTINWGTTQFFNKIIPEIEEGSYDIYFDYDNLLNTWICGAIVKGVAE